MAKTHVYIVSAVLGVSLLMAGCRSGNRLPSHVSPDYLQGTVLDRNHIDVREKTEYLEVSTDQPGGALDWTTRNRLETFIARYVDGGHGPLIMSLPKRDDNSHMGMNVAVEVRALAWQAGIADRDVFGAAYDAQGKPDAPLIMAFKTYVAVAPHCPQLGEVNFARAVSNSDLPTLGCAIRNNMAMMLSDPADIFGGRPLDPIDAERRRVQLEAWRRGEATAAERSDDESAEVSAAVN